MSENKAMQMEDWIRIAGEAGAKVAIEQYKRESERAKKERVDRRLRNTKLLLEHYRDFKAHCSNALFDIRQLVSSEVNAVEILLSMDMESEAIDTYIESIKSSAERTYIITCHIEEMLGVYRHMCENAIKPEERRRYAIIEQRYLLLEEKSADMIAYDMSLDVSTVYKDIRSATSKISCLLFGIDGLNF